MAGEPLTRSRSLLKDRGLCKDKSLSKGGLMDSVETRRQAITAWINKKGQISFAQLKEAFPEVSDMTLRTDLKNLDDQKKIVRIYGGARSVEQVAGADDYLSRRSVTNVEAKKIIAQKALKLITPGLTLYLDSGSTTTLLASQMEDQSNLIVTSSLSCAMELARASQLKVLLPGGSLNRYSMSICGPQGIRDLEKMNFDLAIMGVTSYDQAAGFACNAYEEALMKETALKRAKKRVLLMDTSKLGKTSTFTFARLEDVDLLVSDGRLPSDFLEVCREARVRVV